MLENQHAHLHWLAVQAKAAIDGTASEYPQQLSLLISRASTAACTLSTSDPMSLRERALRVAGLALRIAAAAHREDVRR